MIGSKAERSLEREFMAGLSEEQQQRVVSHIGATTLPQLLATIANLQVLVTGDTGPLHLAVALKPPPSACSSPLTRGIPAPIRTANGIR